MRKWDQIIEDAIVGRAISALLDAGFRLEISDQDGGGCGMDMGFHIVHSLGYALFGEEAEKGVGEEANALRKAIFNADRHYMMQGGRKQEPDPTKPDREWFGAAGYALKHRWL